MEAKGRGMERALNEDPSTGRAELAVASGVITRERRGRGAR